MNYRMIGYVLGRILLIEAGLMVAPLAVSLIYGEHASAIGFLITMGILALLGLALGLRTPKNKAFYAREGFAIVALSWVLLSFFGALPLVFTRTTSLVDGFFEIVSGFTTTGSSILQNVEAVDRGLLFWRSLTHWVGGMGVLVFAMAILPLAEGRGMHILRAEVPGPQVDKLVSRASDTAKILYTIYLVMTVLELVLLLAGGMPVYDAFITAFGTAGTGGFSHLSLSIAAYDNLYFEIVIGVFMLLFGVNFNLYYLLLLGKAREVFRSEELITYAGIVTASTLAIALNIMRLYGSFGEGLRRAFFQVASVITTTGFATADFTLWPEFSQTILVLLMFCGACAGSTGGGIKIARIIILFKSAICDIRKMIHPHAVTTVRFAGKPVDERARSGAMMFLTVYTGIFALSALLLSFENKDLVTNFTAVTTCINNVGPGLSTIGPLGNFDGFSDLGKLLLSLDMLIGRLEIFPMLILFVPTVWKKKIHTKTL